MSHRHPAVPAMPDVVARGQGLVALLREAWREYQRDYARYFASAMVYYLLISLVPLLLLLLAVLGLLLRWSNTVEAARVQALEAIQAGFGADLRMTIEELLRGLEQQSILASAVSLVALAITASKVVRHLRKSFRAIWKVAPPLLSGPPHVVIRQVVAEKVIAFGMVLSGALLVLAAVALGALVTWLAGVLNTPWLVAIPTTLISVPAAFVLLFRYVPPVRLPWQHVWLAALLCSSAWLLGLELLAVYGAFVGSNISAYGAIGALLLGMLWLNAVSQVVFYGAEVCKVTHWWSAGGSAG
ncbi:MAG TPA: YihY/virulence factor BrkB family protein [Gemmatimonadaceae bacterium]